MNFLHKGNRARCILLAAAFCIALPNLLRADADQDWRKITALDAGPQQQEQPKTRDEALKATLAQLALQEKALRDFITDYPRDSRGLEARMRLSHLLAIRSDLENNEALYKDALKILDDLLASPAVPRDKLPDVAYARITLFMHRAQNPNEQESNALLSQILKFKADYPDDPRNFDLLVEIASAYDSDPAKKRDLLNEAVRYADTQDRKDRLNDDFKRLDMLGKPLALKFDSIQGDPVDIASYRGKVVLVYFFAGWSPPSVLGLQQVKAIVEDFPKNKFQLLGISLDDKKAALQTIITRFGLTCPIYFDGKAWKSPLVRSLGINALPTVWLVDKKGNLRVLNAINNTEGLVRALMEED